MGPCIGVDQFMVSSLAPPPPPPPPPKTIPTTLKGTDPL